MATFGARAAGALGLDAAFADLCSTAVSKFAQKPMVQQGAKIAKDLTKGIIEDTAFSEMLDFAGLTPPPSVARASALSSVASAGIKGAFKETANTVVGKAIGEQKKAFDVKPMASPPSLSGMMNNTFSGFASMCAASMPANPLYAQASRPSMPSQSFSKGAPPQQSFSVSIMDAFTRGPSAMPGLQGLVPSFNPAATAGSKAFFPGSFQQSSKGAGGFTSPNISADIDRTPSGPSRNKI
jgi:hypothetical protein